MPKLHKTEKEFKELCKDIVILHDTREQENTHILEWFDKKKVLHQARALDIGDYSFKIKETVDDIRLAGLWYTDMLFIERKNSLDELAQSILQKRFHAEIKLASVIPHKALIIENCTGYGDILAHKYQSNYNPKAFYNSLRKIAFRYGLEIIFVPSEEVNYMVGQHIWTLCKTALEEWLHLSK